MGQIVNTLGEAKEGHTKVVHLKHSSVYVCVHTMAGKEARPHNGAPNLGGTCIVKVITDSLLYPSDASSTCKLGDGDLCIDDVLVLGRIIHGKGCTTSHRKYCVARANRIACNAWHYRASQDP